MDIKLKEITVRELTDNYEDKGDDGVLGYGGKLDIRPPYQREFIYKDNQRDAVITTVKRNYPLNVMYWALRDDGTFEIIDGQQRTISLCQYVNGDFAYEFMYFHNLPTDQQNIILDYKLMIYVCAGTDTEKLEWFKTINIAGEKLTDQELRNAVYAGPWVTSAKKYFSKNNCVAYNIANEYISGSPIRQDFLETAISWINDGNIEMYMASHQNDANASALWIYFQTVISWVAATFPKKRPQMKSINWGKLHKDFNDKVYDAAVLEREIAELMEDEDVTKKSGVYPYVLTRDERYLNIRTFSPKMKTEAYERQKGICVKCTKFFSFDEMEGDHIIAWSRGGKTEAVNCQMLCSFCNGSKSGK